jgi:hypothetical protein
LNDQRCECIVFGMWLLILALFEMERLEWKAIQVGMIVDRKLSHWQKYDSWVAFVRMIKSFPFQISSMRNAFSE